jgi:hypothetical protein
MVAKESKAAAGEATITPQTLLPEITQKPHLDFLGSSKSSVYCS